MTGTLAVMDRTGDTRTTWTLDDPKSLKAAEDLFKSLREKGHTIYKATPGGENTVLHSFDPTAENLIAVPRIVGG